MGAEVSKGAKVTPQQTSSGNGGESESAYVNYEPRLRAVEQRLDDIKDLLQKLDGNWTATRDQLNKQHSQTAESLAAATAATKAVSTATEAISAATATLSKQLQQHHNSGMSIMVPNTAGFGLHSNSALNNGTLPSPMPRVKRLSQLPKPRDTIAKALDRLPFRHGPSAEKFTDALVDALEPWTGSEQVDGNITVNTTVPTTSSNVNSKDMILRDTDSQKLFIVTRGEIEIISANGTVLAHLSTPACIGEIGLLFDREPAATVRVMDKKKSLKEKEKEPFEVFVLERQDFVEILALSDYVGENYIVDRWREKMKARYDSLKSSLGNQWDEFGGEFINDRARLDISSLTLFKGANWEAIMELSLSTVPQIWENDQYIIKAGDKSYEMYFLTSGKVKVESEDGTWILAELEPFAFFGEVGILFSMTRTASVRAVSDCRTLKLTKKAVEAVLENNEALRLNMAKAAKERLEQLTICGAIRADASQAPIIEMSWSSIQNMANVGKDSHNNPDLYSNGPGATSPAAIAGGTVNGTSGNGTGANGEGSNKNYANEFDMEVTRQNLRKVPLFSNCDDELIMTLSSTMIRRSYLKNQTIVRVGEIAHEMYFLTAGETGVLTLLGEELTRFKPGMYFGEIGIIKNVPRVANVIAQTDCTVFVLDRLSMENSFKEHPELLEDIIRKAEDRLQEFLMHEILA